MSINKTDIPEMNKIFKLSLAALPAVAMLSACAFQPISEESLTDEENYLNEQYPQFDNIELTVYDQEGEGYTTYAVGAIVDAGDNIEAANLETLNEIEEYLNKEIKGRSVYASYAPLTDEQKTELATLTEQIVYDSFPSPDVLTMEISDTDSYNITVGYYSEEVTAQQAAEYVSAITETPIPAFYREVRIDFLGAPEYVTQEAISPNNNEVKKDIYSNNCVSFSPDVPLVATYEYEEQTYIRVSGYSPVCEEF